MSKSKDSLIEALREARQGLINIQFRYADYKKGRDSWDEGLINEVAGDIETIEDTLNNIGVSYEID